jgi:hypothetical protein
MEVTKVTTIKVDAHCLEGISNDESGGLINGYLDGSVRLIFVRSVISLPFGS